MTQVQMSLEGFQANATKDYMEFRKKLEDFLREAVEEDVMEQEDMDAFLSEADEVHDNIVFLVDTMKLPSNDPTANKLAGVKKGLAASLTAVRAGEFEFGHTDEYNNGVKRATNDAITAIEGLDANEIAKGA